MTDTQSPNAAGAMASGENLSEAALMARLIEGKPQEQPAAEEPAKEPESEPIEEQEEAPPEAQAEEEAEPEAEDGADEQEDGDVDLLSLEPEQLQALAKKSKSRLLERVGELTAQKKALQAKLDEAEQAKPRAPEVPVDQNPFKDLKSFDEIKARHAAIEQTLEQTDALLEEYEDYGNDDVIVVGNQEYTKKQIKQANRNAREALTKYLPAQGQHLMRLESYKAANVQWQEEAKKEVPEIADAESEVGKAYQALVSDPLIAKLKDTLPELGVQVEYLLAHVAKSKFGSKPKVATGAGIKVKVKPPSSPVGAGAAKPASSKESAYQAAMKRFYETGSPEDWVKAETLKNR